jgi:hypothetical protein
MDYRRDASRDIITGHAMPQLFPADAATAMPLHIDEPQASFSPFFILRPNIAAAFLLS